MNLLDKFENLKMMTDTRISETDIQFCEANQAAYQAAKASLPELSYIWTDMHSTQKDLLAGTGTSANTYLSSGNALSFTDSDIQKQLIAQHTIFIRKLVYYFNEHYHISIDYNTIEENLLPKAPKDNYRSDNKEQIEQYREQMLHLTLSYTDIINQIFIQLDGRDLYGQAIYELKEKCHKAAWNIYHKTPDYKCQKNTLQLASACRYSSWLGSESWELHDGTKHILSGIAHFETGSLSIFPDGFSNLIGYRKANSNEYNFSFCQKIKHLKMFKNGRVDIKFASETYARQFVNDYLGTVC